MADFASLIGGNGDTVPVPDADPSLAFSYFWSSGDVAINLGAKGDIWDSSKSDGNVTVEGGRGSDTLAGGSGDDSFSGGAGKEAISTRSGEDVVAGGRGADTADAGTEADTVHGGSGADLLAGGRGDDVVYGGRGDDTLLGGAGRDTIYGGAGDDSIVGGDGRDVLFGGAGNDFLEGGARDDVLTGGEGSDVFFFDSNFGNDVITDLSDGDEIFLTADVNGSGIASAQDLVDQGLIGGGTDPATSQPFTTITIGADTIRIENMNQADFASNISTWVKIV